MSRVAGRTPRYALRSTVSRSSVARSKNFRSRCKKLLLRNVLAGTGTADKTDTSMDCEPAPVHQCYVPEDVNAKDNEGKTPPLLATEKVLHETVLLLAQRGADVNATDMGNRTLLDLVAYQSETKAGDGQTQEIGELLRSLGGTCARYC